MFMVYCINIGLKNVIFFRGLLQGQTQQRTPRTLMKYSNNDSDM